MPNQTVSVRQGVMMIVMFLLGTTFLVSAGLEAGRDIWIAYILSMAASLVLACMYARMMSLRPGKDFLYILEDFLGRPLSVIFLILMSVYLMQHYAYVVRHFSEFVYTAGSPGTPILVSMLTMGLLSALAVYHGVEVLGKWSELTVFFVAAFIIGTTILLAKNMDINHVRPVLEEGLMPAIKGSWMLTSFPFGQVLAFLFILPPFENRKDPYKILTLGLLLGGFLVFLSSICNVLVLGVPAVERLYYPTFSTLAIIRLGDFIQRMEIVATTIFTVSVFLKATVLLMGVMKSLAKIFRLNDYHFLIMPVMLLAVNYAYNAYSGHLEHQTGITVYVPYFSTFYQVVIPVIFFILLEIKAAKRRKGIPDIYRTDESA